MLGYIEGRPGLPGLRSELELAHTSDALHSLYYRLSVEPPAEVFAALFSIASRGQDQGPAAGAAYLLFAINPAAAISSSGALAALLESWDISIEEVPWYLARQFGVAQLRADIANLRTKALTSYAAAVLRTVEYWLKIFEEMSAEEIEIRASRLMHRGVLTTMRPLR